MTDGMRVALLLVVLVACKDKPAEQQRPPIAEDDPEERCDPKETKVCVGTRVVACEDGKLGRALRQCPDTCRKGKCVGSCAEGAELIYVVDSHDQLMSFDPRKIGNDPFKLVGVMNCPAAGSPFSMSVDRSGTAWVLYTDGSVHEVSTIDATCKPSGFSTNSSFGMGFTSDEPGSKKETLYVAMNDGSHGLSTIDTMKDVPSIKSVGRLPFTSRHPELTGTSEGKLFGFFPDDGERSFVQEIDKTTGSFIGDRLPLGASLDFVGAYAFAHWGGVFYIFVSGATSTVRAIDRKTGAYQLLMDNLPTRIVGAGVSTCAPERDQPKTATGPN